MLVIFLKSFLLGVAVAAPLGPVGMMCLTRTLTRGFWFGFSGGVGIALADAFYAVIAATMYAVVAEMLSGVSLSFAIAGGLIVVGIGIGIMFGKAERRQVQITAGNMAASCASAFGLTLLNPLTVLLFVAVFAGLGLGEDLSFGTAVTLISGVFAGSLAWWFLLAGGVSMVRKRLSDNFALWVTRISGILIIAFGVAAIVSAIVKWQ